MLVFVVSFVGVALFACTFRRLGEAGTTKTLMISWTVLTVLGALLGVAVYTETMPTEQQDPSHRVRDSLHWRTTAMYILWLLNSRPSPPAFPSPSARACLPADS